MLQKICGFLSGILIIGLTVLAAILILPRIAGYQSLAVLSGSMEPKISVGAIVFAKDVVSDEIAVGDVITYRISGTTMVTHRVAEIDQENKLYYTKGDANEDRDAEPVQYDNIFGKVAFSVPYVGYLSIYAKTPLGIAGICGILIVLILLIFLPEIFKKENEEISDETKVK